MMAFQINDLDRKKKKDAYHLIQSFYSSSLFKTDVMIVSPGGERNRDSLTGMENGQFCGKVKLRLKHVRGWWYF